MRAFLLLAISCLLLTLVGAAAGVQGPRQIDINTAGVEELDELPGIGPAIARRIVEYREENGPFKKIEDLMNVRGVGEKKFLQLKDLVRVAPPEPAPKQES